MAIFLALGLNLHPNEIPSPLVDKVAPVFSAPKLQTPEQKLTPADLKGKVWLFNVWASWCVSCRSEHPILNQMAKTKTAVIVGLNYKDEPEDAKNWLSQLGNPYDVSIMDQDGRIGIDYDRKYFYLGLPNYRLRINEKIMSCLPVDIFRFSLRD
ncbi:MAG: redoxin family protein [Methylobacter sp.]|nr:redoxin family protein [Methylobacter sp.]